MSTEPDLSIPRRGPRPANDEAVDSAEVSTSVRTTSPTRRPVGRPRQPKPEAVIQFSTRMAQSYRDCIDEVERDTGQTIRQIIETALRETYSEYYHQPKEQKR